MVPCLDEIRRDTRTAPLGSHRLESLLPDQRQQRAASGIASRKRRFSSPTRLS